MAQYPSETLTRVFSSPSFLLTKSPSIALSSRFLNHENRSNRSKKAQLIKVDLDSQNEVKVLGMRTLEVAIHGIIVRRSAPDWLPFLPGSSYRVPPRRLPHVILELVGKSENPLKEEESLSLSTVKSLVRDF